jgi:hypothetical protein
MDTDYVGLLCGVGKLFYEWQTLVTGLLALLAAYIAARPVWRQITSLQIQSEVMARETLIMRVTAIESRRDATRKKIESITHEFLRAIYPYGECADPNINTEWAFEAEKIVDTIVVALIAHQETSLDGELIDTKRSAAIEQAKELSDCLSEIHAPYSCDLHDPELNLTEEQIAAATAASPRAEGHLEECISAVRTSGAELDAAFKVTLEQLRGRIRQIDVVVVR